MKNFTLINYDQRTVHKEEPAFYIIFRGLSAGMPTPQPLTPCYGFYCDPQDAADYYYHVFSLWQADVFQEYMLFNKIPQITDGDIRHVIVSTIEIIDQLEKSINQHYAAIDSTRSPLYKKRILEAVKIHLQFNR